jgi:hypothetical protein
MILTEVSSLAAHNSLRLCLRLRHLRSHDKRRSVFTRATAVATKAQNAERQNRIFHHRSSPSRSAAVALTPAAELTYGTALLSGHSSERMGKHATPQYNRPASQGLLAQRAQNRSSTVFSSFETCCMFCRPNQCSLTNSYVDDNSCLISK